MHTIMYIKKQINKMNWMIRFILTLKNKMNFKIIINIMTARILSIMIINKIIDLMKFIQKFIIKSIVNTIYF